MVSRKNKRAIRWVAYSLILAVVLALVPSTTHFAGADITEPTNVDSAIVAVPPIGDEVSDVAPVSGVTVDDVIVTEPLADPLEQVNKDTSTLAVEEIPNSLPTENAEESIDEVDNSKQSVDGDLPVVETEIELNNLEATSVLETTIVQ